MVENTERKGEIALDEQFLLFPTVFRRPLQQSRKTQGLLGKVLNLCSDDKSLDHSKFKAIK